MQKRLKRLVLKTTQLLASKKPLSVRECKNRCKKRKSKQSKEESLQKPRENNRLKQRLKNREKLLKGRERQRLTSLSQLYSPMTKLRSTTSLEASRQVRSFRITRLTKTMRCMTVETMKLKVKVKL